MSDNSNALISFNLHLSPETLGLDTPFKRANIIGSAIIKIKRSYNHCRVTMQEQQYSVN
jgi:hypothetical protein